MVTQDVVTQRVVTQGVVIQGVVAQSPKPGAHYKSARKKRKRKENYYLHIWWLLSTFIREVTENSQQNATDQLTSFRVVREYTKKNY